MYEGWALYMDCDMLVRTDINEIFEEYNLDYYPVYCVKHKYEPTDDFGYVTVTFKIQEEQEDESVS